ncbi:MAG: hypothetical protein ACERKV_01375 [Clostridiaceae bacterium]
MSKTFFNDNLLLKVIKTITDFKSENKQTFYTTDAIKKQVGRYVKDNCSPDDSFNANFGKFLKSNEKRLGIVEIGKDRLIKDDCGNPTTCSEWKIL